jgi:DNA-binding GntR family transcriptional regulator
MMSGGATQTPLSDSIVRVDLNDQVYEAIKRLLLTREFPGGAKLSLQRLADDLDVSRSPVAHALTRLVTEGLVLNERRGFVVRPLTAQLVEEAHEARLALELHAAELTVGRVAEAELAEFYRLTKRTIDPVHGAQIVDTSSYMIANKEFHEYQVDLARNTFISEMYRRLCIHQLMERTIIVLGVSAAGGSSSEHREIYNAVVAGDLDRTRTALRANVETGKRIANEAIEQVGGTL